MVFETKKIDPARTGEILRGRRAELHIEIREASRELKIPAKYLEWLEEGAYHRLPAPLYVKAFFKKYAQFLKLDVLSLLEDLERELDVSNIFFEDSHVSSPHAAKQRKGYLVGGVTLVTPMGIRIFIVLLFFFLVLGYLVYQLNFIIRSPELIILDPREAISSIQAESVTIYGKTRGGARLTMNGRDVYVDDEGNFRETILLHEGINTFTFEVSTRFSKKNEKIMTIFRENAPASEPAEPIPETGGPS